MDHLALGAALRTARIRRRWRHVDVAQRARSSQPFISKLERGQLRNVRLGDLERVAVVLEVRLDLRAWWRGGELDRLRAGHHSAIDEIVTALLLELGWEVASEPAGGGDSPERSRVTETGSLNGSRPGS